MKLAASAITTTAVTYAMAELLKDVAHIFLEYGSQHDIVAVMDVCNKTGAIPVCVRTNHGASWRLVARVRTLPIEAVTENDGA